MQNSKLSGMCLPPPVSQSTPKSISSISSESRSDLDMDQGDIKDETTKQVAQPVSQTLLISSTGNPISTLTQNDPLHDNVTNVQSTHDSNPSTIHSQVIPNDQSYLKTVLHIQIQF